MQLDSLIVITAINFKPGGRFDRCGFFFIVNFPGKNLSIRINVKILDICIYPNPLSWAGSETQTPHPRFEL